MGLFNIFKGNKLSKEEQTAVLLDALKKYDTEESSFSASIESVDIPVKAGRSSVPDHFLEGTPELNTPIATSFPFKFLHYVENGQVFNPHISYGAENILTLGLTPFNITFDDSVSEKQSAEMREDLKLAWGSWYDYSGGIESLISDLFIQLSVFGCVSAEVIPNESLTGVQKIAKVSPHDIRFVYSKLEDKYYPVQQASVSSNGSANGSGYTRLNTTTYSYLAKNKYGKTPYATPPFFSALESVITEDGMVDSFRNLIKRIGVLGFLSVLVKPPSQLNGETPAKYKERVEQYLKDTLPQAEQSFHKGVAVGFKDQHEFNVEGNNANMQGAQEAMDLVKKLIYSGLKQDPSMHGENFSTTESFARVILAKMTKSVETYQVVISQFLEDAFFQHLILRGWAFKGLEVKFDKPTTSDRLKDVQVDNQKFDLYKKEYDQGLIDQTQFAQLMGYDAPSEAGPTNTTDTEETVDIEEDVEELKKKIKSNAEFEYEIPKGCEDDINKESLTAVSNFKDPYLTKNSGAYVRAVNKQYSKAINLSSKQLEKEIASLTILDSVEAWKGAIFNSIYKGWDEKFTNKIEPTTEKYIDKIYSHYRNDEAIFSNAKNFRAVKGGLSFFDIPDAVFDLLDYRTIEYLEGIDGIYLGQFVTDKDTINRINRWVEDAFAEGNLPVGDNVTTNQFINEFKDTLGLESWKIRRVIETTVNKARNYANIKYIDQAGLQLFEVVEVMDNRTCPYCSHMDGKEFRIDRAVEQIDKLTSSSPSEIGNVTPFATSVPLGVFQTLSADDLQGMGFAAPSYHPHCRGSIVSVI
jgi:SPP1 gp7 family putative phage head morphogenesis protein